MNKPGFDGRFEVGHKIVDDPLEPGAQLGVAVNIRRDIIEWLYSCRVSKTGERLINEAQRKAGNYFLSLLERAEEARGLAVDYQKQRVDSSRGLQDISVDRSDAMRKLDAVRQAIGDADYRHARAVIGSGAPIGLGAPTDRGKRQYAKRFYDALSKMAYHWHWDGSDLNPESA